MVCFSHGIHAPDHKMQTSHLPIRRLEFSPVLHLPLDQHIGKPAISVVTRGQEVLRGEVIAKADGFLSVPIHAPASGVIEAIELRPGIKGPKTTTIVLRPYPADGQVVMVDDPVDIDQLTHDEFIQRVQNCGLVGLGGAAFPSHAKLAVPKDHRIHTFIANGCECEPYLTTDHRVMLEYTDDLIRGTLMCMHAVGASLAIIGIEDNKLDAANAIRQRLPTDSPIRVQVLETKYPQGAEKMLVKSLLDIEIPTGKHSYEYGIVINNVGTITALGQLLPRGQGLIERVVTVAGPGVERPGNYIMPIGTPLKFLLEQAGSRVEHAEEIIMGGPMMGSAAASLDIAITKGTSGILIFNEAAIVAETRKIHACIRCGECLSVCPLNLNPSMLGLLARRRSFDEMAEKYHLDSCFECGCCTYVCPSNIPLVQYFRIAKAINREKRAA
ncbi:MAG: electron transport complex subunit RsxC [Gammaproteobacteria bacterium]|nr:electron transport complex subunit RsxC [Gammaproteobacteria bacterium]